MRIMMAIRNWVIPVVVIMCGRTLIGLNGGIGVLARRGNDSSEDTSNDTPTSEHECKKIWTSCKDTTIPCCEGTFCDRKLCWEGKCHHSSDLYVPYQRDLSCCDSTGAPTYAPTFAPTYAPTSKPECKQLNDSCTYKYNNYWDNNCCGDLMCGGGVTQDGNWGPICKEISPIPGSDDPCRPKGSLCREKIKYDPWQREKHYCCEDGLNCRLVDPSLSGTLGWVGWQCADPPSIRDPNIQCGQYEEECYENDPNCCDGLACYHFRDYATDYGFCRKPPQTHMPREQDEQCQELGDTCLWSDKSCCDGLVCTYDKIDWGASPYGTCKMLPSDLVPYNTIPQCKRQFHSCNFDWECCPYTNERVHPRTFYTTYSYCSWEENDTIGECDIGYYTPEP